MDGQGMICTCHSYSTVSKTTKFPTRLLNSEFADNNFKFAENSRKLSKSVENTVGKGEIAFYEQFLLFPQCFQKTSTADTFKPGLVWERVDVLVCFQRLGQ